MPDQFTDEQIELLFAELRANAMTQVRPPGVPAARHTVRQRRAVRSVAASAAVLAVAGGVAIADHSGGAIGRATSHQQAAGPASERSIPPTLTEQAAAAVGLEPLEPGGSPYPLSGRGPVDRQWVRSHHVIGGTYLITMSCAGDDGDDLDVVLRSGPAPEGGGGHPENLPVVWQDTMSCRPASTSVMTTSVVVPGNGMLAIEVDPDASTAGRVSLAYRARLRPADQQAFTDRVTGKAAGTSRLTGVAQLSQFLDDGVEVQHNNVAPGAYRIRMSCAGAGAVDVSVRVYPDANAADPLGGQRVVLKRVTCRTAPVLDQADFVKVGTGALAIWLEPDERARGQAAASFRVDAR